jgi:HEAT repeat protein
MDKPTRQERRRQWQRRNHRLFSFLAPVFFVLHSALNALSAKSGWKGFLVAAATALALAAFAYYLSVLKGRRDLPDWVNDLADATKIGSAWERVKASGQTAVPYLRRIVRSPYFLTFDAATEFEVRLAQQSAALLLGRLKAKEAVPELLSALRNLDPDLRAAALWALGEIGETQIVPALIPLLSDGQWATVRWMDEPPERQKKSQQICDWATEALTKLGEGELVRAFWGVLERGDKEALKFLRSHPRRKAIVEALTRVLERAGTGVTRACNVAWALGEMGAIEALPKLRKVARAWFTPERFREACKRAIAKLEMLSRLPRPADLTAFATSNLPKPADLTELSTETLPRPATAPKEGEANGSE